MRLDKRNKRILKILSAGLIAVLLALELLPAPLALQTPSAFFKGFVFDKYTLMELLDGAGQPVSQPSRSHEPVGGALAQSKQASNWVPAGGHPMLLIYRTLMRGGGYDHPAIESAVINPPAPDLSSIRPARQVDVTVTKVESAPVASSPESSPLPQPPPPETPPETPPPADPPPGDPPPVDLPPEEPSEDPSGPGGENRGGGDDKGREPGDQGGSDDHGKGSGHGKDDNSGKGSGHGKDDNSGRGGGWDDDDDDNRGRGSGWDDDDDDDDDWDDDDDDDDWDDDDDD